MTGDRTRKARAWVLSGVASGLAIVLAACAAAPAPVGPVDATMGVGVVHDPAATGPMRNGYLTSAVMPDATATIPPAPTEGDPRNTADWAIFKATRAMQGSERWDLAVNDDSYKTPDLLKDFSCAVGAELTVENSPSLATLMQRASQDAANAAAAAKEVYKRRRPFLDNEGEICIARSEGLMKSYDYPSGHSSASWVEGLILAELVPDRSAQVLARARAYGESRVVCGVHNYSAVQAGRTNAAGVFAALHESDAFQADMTRAKSELAAARAVGPAPDAARCAREAELTRPLFSAPATGGAN
ncbi:MAG: phosphatase PAP2 family protein [Hyphomonadaceae bacterium]